MPIRHKDITIFRDIFVIYETHITECAKPKCKISILDNAIVVKAAEPTGRE